LCKILAAASGGGEVKALAMDETGIVAGGRDGKAASF